MAEREGGMNLCSDNHDEVCYECRNCPACAAIQALAESDETITARDATIDELTNEIATLKENQ